MKFGSNSLRIQNGKLSELSLVKCIWGMFLLAFQLEFEDSSDISSVFEKCLAIN